MTSKSTQLLAIMSNMHDEACCIVHDRIQASSFCREQKTGSHAYLALKNDANHDAAHQGEGGLHPPRNGPTHLCVAMVMAVATCGTLKDKNRSDEYQTSERMREQVMNSPTSNHYIDSSINRRGHALPLTS